MVDVNERGIGGKDLEMSNNGCFCNCGGNQAFHSLGIKCPGSCQLYLKEREDLTEMAVFCPLGGDSTFKNQGRRQQ